MKERRRLEASTAKACGVRIRLNVPGPVAPDLCQLPLSFARFLNKRAKYASLAQGFFYLRAASRLAHGLCKFLLRVSRYRSPAARPSLLQRQGTGFKQAENDRVTITDASLQAVNLNGNYYVRWSFAIRPKQAAALSLVRIEDVSDPAPLLLVNDVAPQLDAGKWTENAGLMDPPPPSVRWLFEPKETVRIFRFTISEPDGQSYVLYQAVQYSPASKEAIRAMVR